MKKYVLPIIIALISFRGFQAAALSVPSATGLFESSLQSRITGSDSSLTLTSTSTRGGGTLGGGYHCFTIDEGLSTAEWVCGTLSGSSNVVSSLERGTSPKTGTTTISSLQSTHRVGASAKITDFPLLQRLKALLNGEDMIPHIIRYDSIATTTIDDDRNNLVTWGLLQDTALNGTGALAASDTQLGYVEMATGAEAASSTNTGGTGARLALGANIATSTFSNPAAAALKVVVTGNSAKIDNNALATSTLFATSSIYTAIPTIGSVGKNIQVFTSTGTTTFSVPSGVTRFTTYVIGGGGNGGDCASGGSQGSAGGGGGAGGTAMEFLDLTGTSTIQVYVGAATEWSTFGTNGFYSSASAGTRGVDESDGSIGGIGSGGTLNFRGGSGGGGKGDGSTRSGNSGVGGSSMFGGGGAGKHITGSTGTAGAAGGLYGGGGSGAACDNSQSASGGAGAQGAVWVTW